MFLPRYRRLGKRLFDLTLIIPALFLLAPVLGLITLLVRLKLGAPVLFRQQRPGHHGQPFTILKFRTMTGARDAQGQLLPDAERLTRLGRFLRRTSLDELPELLNVLKGEMSLVGPRPLLMKYLNRYDPVQMRRQEVKPGITGWAQINGRNGLSWEEKLQFDIWYVDHPSLWLDLKILLLSVRTVVRRDGISQPGHATMTEFPGHGHNGAATAVDSNFSPEFRAQLVLELISGVKSIRESCREHNLQPELLARWQADFLENAARAFRNDELSSPEQ